MANNSRHRFRGVAKKNKVKTMIVNNIGRLGRFIGRALATAARGGKKGNPKVVSDPAANPTLPGDQPENNP